MVAQNGGKYLSQDRLSYYIFEELGMAGNAAKATNHLDDPFGDLGHGKGVDQADMALTLDWIYGQSVGTSKWSGWYATLFENTTPVKDSIKEFLDDGRPVIRVYQGHAVIVDGYMYMTDNGTQKIHVHIVDPWYSNPAITSRWEILTTTNQVTYNFPPPTGQPVKSDEAELAMDSDGDGLTDFDETKRLQTDPNNSDSDGDGIDDQTDMLDYLFLVDGSYMLRNRDMDNDGFAKELDPDNDHPSDNGEIDGCEDANRNGFYDPDGKETDNFVTNDDWDIVNPKCLRGKIKAEYIFNIHQQGVNLDQLFTEEILIEHGDFTKDDFIHKHQWLRTMSYSFPELDCSASGSDSGEGVASVQLDLDDSTGEYFLITDTNTMMRDWTFDNRIPPIMRYWITSIPVRFYFAGGNRHPLGFPEEVNGGLRLKGEWNPPAEIGVDQSPMFTHLISWDIWITPPTK
ncbi:MAG: hypothetical protein ABIC40_08760 [bacterium]